MSHSSSPRHSAHPYRTSRTSVLPTRSAGRSRRRGRAALAAVGVSALGLAILVPMTGSSSAAQNLVKNAGIEKGLKNWTRAEPGRSIDVVGSAHSGTSASRLTTKVPGTMSLRDTPNSVTDTERDTTYVASAWVRTSTPGVAVSLRLREVQQQFNPGTTVRTLVRKQSSDLRLPDRAWHKLVLVVSPQPGHQLDLGIFVWRATRAQDLLVDDVALIAQRDGEPAPSTPAAAPSPTPSTSDPGRPNVVTPTPKPTTSPSSPAPTPTPSSTGAPAPVPAPSGDTLFGVAPWADPGESNSAAVARLDSTLGRSEVLRVFYPGLPVGWPGAAGNAQRPVVVSFKASPRDVVSGSLDGTLRSWFAGAPRDRTIYWSYYHEPEDNIASGEYTAADYRAAWTHLRALSQSADNPKLKSTLILMAWSLTKNSGRDWRDYYPGSGVIDVLGWDAYNSGANSKKAAAEKMYQDPAKIYQEAVDVSRAEGKPFGFAEWGSLMVPGDDGTGRAAWIRTTASYFRAQGAAFATYFNTPVGGEYRLFDAPSQDALRDAIHG